MTLVAMSAAYGAGGSRIGPELARRLGVPFVDRGIPIAVAQRLDVPVAEAIAEEDEVGGRSLLERLLAGFAAADSAIPTAPTQDLPSGDDFHRASVEVIREQAAHGHGVILGRGAVAALRGDPRVLRVRLTGPAAPRVQLGMRLGGVDEPTARAAQRRLDGAHAEYLRRYYGLDIDDPRLYHLILDVPAIGIDTAIQLLQIAAQSFEPVKVRDARPG